MGDDRLAHSWLPEFGQMIDHAANGGGVIRVAGEEGADVISHFD